MLGCQLRKLEVTKKTYEVATDKLLHFVEVILVEKINNIVVFLFKYMIDRLHFF